MGVFTRLFGKSDRATTGAARCNECGMTGGGHTDWCPTLQEEAEPGAPETGGGKTAPTLNRPPGAPS